MTTATHNANALRAAAITAGAIRDRANDRVVTAVAVRDRAEAAYTDTRNKADKADEAARAEAAAKG